jgi:hypothetical protein
MQSSRDSSVWRTLAVAFGDGLAFGVGVTLTRNAARLAAIGSAPPEPRSLNQRIAELEERTRRARAAALPAAPSPELKAAGPTQAALDNRFAEIGGQIDRRLAELGSKIQDDLHLLDAQDHELAEGVEVRIDLLRREIAETVSSHRQEIDAEMLALRAQLTAVHKEFAETLARLVDEQIANTVATRLQAVEESLRETVRQEVRLSGKDRQDSAVPPPELTVAAAPGEAAAADPVVPAFARPLQRKPLWRIPIVSSFLFATAGLLLLHYL